MVVDKLVNGRDRGLARPRLEEELMWMVVGTRRGMVVEMGRAGIAVPPIQLPGGSLAEGK